MGGGSGRSSGGGVLAEEGFQGVDVEDGNGVGQFDGLLEGVFVAGGNVLTGGKVLGKGVQKLGNERLEFLGGHATE